MYRGETVTTTITGFPIPVSEIKNLYVVFKNGFRTLLEKTLEDCTISGETLEFTLTQQESLLLSKGNISRSAIVITKDGSRFESCSSPFMCRETVKDEVLS